MGSKALKETLEHLSYIMECILIEANGDAKFELDQLIKSVKERVAHNEIQKSLLDELEEASRNFQSGDRRKGLGQISSISRSLWRQFMSQ